MENGLEAVRRAVKEHIDGEWSFVLVPGTPLSDYACKSCNNKDRRPGGKDPVLAVHDFVQTNQEFNAIRDAVLARVLLGRQP